MTALVGVIALALLFAAFGLLGITSACSGSCESCKGTCHLRESDHVHD